MRFLITIFGPIASSYLATAAGGYFAAIAIVTLLTALFPDQYDNSTSTATVAFFGGVLGTAGGCALTFMSRMLLRAFGFRPRRLGRDT
jgi:hypothetical protein